MDVVEKIQDAIDNLENKNFKLIFFVMDSKGVPSGSLAYIYTTAYRLHEKGYKVKMLYADDDFVGVGGWLGEKYAALPHEKNEKGKMNISPEDFMFIPEVWANVMTATKDLPCKRVVILQNENYMTDIIPDGVSWGDLKIRDCVATTNRLSYAAHEYFPGTFIRRVRPSIPDYFRKGPKKAQDLVIGIVANDPREVHAMLKPFYWKYPDLSWVPFKYVANQPREEFSKILSDFSAVVWCDTTTDFGYSALEAMACGNIVIGKVPENEPDWMLDEKGQLKDNGIWFYKYNQAADAIAMFVKTFISDEIPEKIYDEMAKTVLEYTEEKQNAEIDEIYEQMFSFRKKELEEFLRVYKEKQLKNE